MSMSSRQVVALVRAGDPLDPSELGDWAASPRREELVRAIVATPVGPSGAAHRGRSRLVVIVAVATLAGAAAAAAATMLGGPALETVRQHLADLDRGMPADLRYNPDLANARAVAATPSGTLYAADLPDGGYCVEVASGADRPRGGTCVHASAAARQPIEVIAPIPANEDAPLLVGGHLNAADLATVRVRYAENTSGDVTLGLDRYFLLEVPVDQRVTALDDGLELLGLDVDGRVAAQVSVPPLRDDDDSTFDERQPIFVSTVSDGSDFTLLLGIEGRVNISGYATLELAYPDGTMVAIPTEVDGSYRFDLPTDRRDDFARAFGVLTARDSNGRPVATAPVASVAAWRAHTE